MGLACLLTGTAASVKRSAVSFQTAAGEQELSGAGRGLSSGLCPKGVCAVIKGLVCLTAGAALANGSHSAAAI